MVNYLTEKQFFVKPYFSLSGGYQSTYRPTSTLNINGETSSTQSNKRMGYTKATMNAGIDLKNENWKFNVEGGIGSTIEGKTSLSYNKELVEGFGLEFNTKAEASRTLTTKNVKSTTNTEFIVPNDTGKKININQVTNVALHDSSQKLSFGGAITHTGKRHEIKVGGEFGWRGVGPGEINLNNNINYSNSSYNTECNIDLRENGFYVTPTVNVKIDSKNSNRSYIANVDKYSGSIGIRYNF